MENLSSNNEQDFSQPTLKFFETLLHASNDGILITDANQNIVVANDAFAAIFNENLNTVVGSNLFTWLKKCAVDSQRRWAEMEIYVRTNDTCPEMDFEIKTNSKKKYLSVNASILHYDSEKNAGLIVSIWRDITKHTEQKNQLQSTLKKLQETQQQLVETKKMASLANLVAGIAHEINTPVGIGLTAASSLIDKTDHFEMIYQQNKIRRSDFEIYLHSVKQAGKLIVNNMQRTADLIKSFMRVSVDENSNQQRCFKLKSYLEDIIRSLQPKLKDKSIDIKIECDERIQLTSFPDAFAQIMTNLILNSKLHVFRNQENGKITITIKVKEQNLNLIYKVKIVTMKQFWVQFYYKSINCFKISKFT